jgi:dTDP-4-dehydrorhamnose reductase
MRDKRVLITGASGFLASRLLRKLDENYNVVGVSRKNLNLLDYGEVFEVFKMLKPDMVIHTAAITATLDCENDPREAYKINVDGSLNLAKAARKNGSKMLFLSSEQVFNGNPEDGPYSEDDTPVPNTIYGETKLKAEELLREEIQNLWILRLSWLFGFPERNMPNGENLPMKLMNAVISNKAVSIANNEFRGIIHAYDLIDNIEKIFELPYDTYHFGSENDSSTYEMAVFIMESLGFSKDVIDSIVIPDNEKYRNKKRDLRMSYEKIKSNGIEILTSKESVLRALSQYGLLKK